MNTPLDTIEYKGCAIKVYPDVDVENPRNDDNLGTMVCFHKRHLLGDENHGYTSNDYHGWDEVEAAIQKDEAGAIILPLYLYDHSGITMRTTPFDCHWDSGQVGLIFVSKKKARAEFGEVDRQDHETSRRNTRRGSEGL